MASSRLIAIAPGWSIIDRPQLLDLLSRAAWPWHERMFPFEPDRGSRPLSLGGSTCADRRRGLVAARLGCGVVRN
jgi:hypothetical protein